MGRMPRSFIKGEIYHITQRGNNREHIFRNSSDKNTFMNIVRGVKHKVSFDLLYYVLMDNHYHLVIRMANDNISNVMQRLNWSYSNYFNKKYDRCGTIFGQRFKAYHVRNNRYLRALVKYIAMNPVRSRQTDKPDQYQWSAHTDFALNHMSIADKKSLLDLFDSDKKKAWHAYLYLIEQIPQEMHRDDMRDLYFKERLSSLRAYLNIMMSSNKKNYILNNRIKEKKRFLLMSEFINKAINKGFSPKELAQLFNVDQQRIYFIKNTS